MKIIQKAPKTKYPYLAVENFGDHVNEIEEWDVDDILIVSKIGDRGIYVQNLTGKESGLFIKNENNYTPLPKGFEITLIQ